jgi:hypothetical protein
VQQLVVNTPTIKEMAMRTEEHDAQNVPENPASSMKVPFNATVVLVGATLGGILGAVVALVVTALAGVEWPLRLVVAPQLALSFAVMGAWIAVSFSQDDRDDTASVRPLPVDVHGSNAAASGIPHKRRAAA